MASSSTADTDELDRRWRDAEEDERRSRAVFAQNTLRPEEVIPEWQRWQTLLGGAEDVRRFLTRAMGRLNAALEPSSEGTELAHLDALPPTVVERLAARGLQGTRRITFQEPAPPNAAVVVRSHPLPSTLADFLLESALQPNETTGRLSDVAAFGRRKRVCSNLCSAFPAAIQTSRPRSSGEAAVG